MGNAEAQRGEPASGTSPSKPSILHVDYRKIKAENDNHFLPSPFWNPQLSKLLIASPVIKTQKEFLLAGDL